MVTDRKKISSGAPWEDVMGYSRAVRVGSSVYVSGTTSTDTKGNIVGGDDLYRQTAQTLKNVRRALRRSGAGMTDVVRTRIYVTDITRWKEVARAHSQFFKEVKPATSLVEISRLIEPEMLVEIEAIAVI